MNWTKYKLVKNFQRVIGKQLKLDRKEGKTSSLLDLIFNKVDKPLVPYYLRLFSDEIRLIADSEKLQKRIFFKVKDLDKDNPFVDFSDMDNRMFLRYLSQKYINSKETI